VHNLDQSAMSIKVVEVDINLVFCVHNLDI